ncbi:MAG TPA: branched-chain amino acid ABC transporter permease [Actinomycetota bacterium]
MPILPECLRGGFWPHTFDGITTGSIYAMIALGYTMVYGVLQLINFAHSEIFMIATFAGLYTLRALGVGGPIGGVELVAFLAVALMVSMAASGATAVALERVAYRPLRRRGAPRLAFLLTAIGASLFLSNLFLVWRSVGGPSPVAYPDVMARRAAFSAFGYDVSNKQLLVVGTMVVMYVMLDRFVMRTRTGRGIRAVAEDPDTAALMGVDINRVIVVTFLVGGLMAGAAGFLYGMFFGQARYNIGFIPGIKAFTAAVLGGIGNIRGAMLGGLLLGLFENLGVTCVGIQWQDVIAFLILVLFLMFRPSGILGERVRA